MDAEQVIEDYKPMSRLHLIYDWVVISDWKHILTAMNDPNFKPDKRVILEQEPDIARVKNSDKNKVQIIRSGTDHLLIEARLKTSAILLITDSYSKGWSAKSLADSSQKNYEIIPANYIFQAIPLNKGYHSIYIEYRPQLFVIGKWITIVSIICYLIMVTGYYLHKFRTPDIPL